MSGSTYIYIEPVVYTPEDSETYAAKRTYSIQECGETLIANNEAALWCNNLCAQDEKYCNPFIVGDKIYFQYRNDTVEYWKILPKIYNGEDNSIIASDAYITTEEGADENGNNYVNIIIDTTALPITCWYLKTYLFACPDVDPASYDDCVAAAEAGGATPEEAELSCSIELCGEGVSEITSEPYCLYACDETLLFTCDYPVKDCEGNYYGDFADDYFPTNSFKMQVRIVGELKKTNFSFESTIINNNKQKTIQKDSYQLMSRKLPPYVVELLAICFNAQNLYVDAVEYDNSAELAKNNEFGQMWIINTVLTKKCEQINFNCES